ncbi:hypothetical protein [Kineococcus gypseus]|uniref:hypothetical protein n=1 Tax=Kineococcus gypseus TaxID=1637102 RepID=UPI003D7DD3E7
MAHPHDAQLPDAQLRAALQHAAAHTTAPDDDAPAQQWHTWMDLQEAGSTLAGCAHTVLAGGQLDRHALAQASHLLDAAHDADQYPHESAAWRRVRDLLQAR